MRKKNLFPVEDKLKEYLPLYGNCAQSSFLVLQEQFGLNGGAILKALSPFPGIALRGETCGAVVGCLMALGLVYGEEIPSDPKEFPTSLAPAKMFCDSFVQERGSTMCCDIIELELGKRYNLADPIDVQNWIESGGREKCQDVIVGALHITGALITEKR